MWGLGSTLYALAYFLPQIVSGFGYSLVHTQLLAAAPFFAAFLFTLLTAWYSDKYGSRGLCAMICSTIGLVGYVMFYCSLLTSVRYVALFLAVTGIYSVSSSRSSGKKGTLRLTLFRCFDRLLPLLSPGVRPTFSPSFLPTPSLHEFQ